MTTRRRIRLAWRAARGRLAVAALLALAATACLLPMTAHAVPSYARQTGSECAACHVGGFGPQLTPYGVRFKINGYTDSDGKDGKIPLSAMMVGNWTHTAKGAAEGDRIDHFKSNDNSAMQEASVFLAGRLTDNIGTFVQSTYSGVDKRWALDQFDVRYARATSLGGKEATIGLAVNGNPTLTDPFNTLGQWRFPYTSSDFNAGFGPSPLVENLAGGVAGVNAYTLFDKHYYAEVGVYDTLSKRALSAINADDPGKFKGLGTYWRLAYVQDWKRDNFSVGLFGFNARLHPERDDPGATDRHTDLGVDASYQFLGNREHIYTVNGSYVRERMRLGYTHGQIGEADRNTNTLDQYRLAASYHYAQTWGATLGWFQSHGSRDAALYGDSLRGRPDTAGYVLQADWTPWGKESSWGAPWANVRLGLQYTGYNRYMGGSHYYDADGNTRRARDNNTTMLFLWLSI